MVGSLAGGFRLVRKLGEGGAGVVYLAERTGDFSQMVAVKLLLDAGPEAARRFQMEKESLASLPHPGIVQLIDAGLTEGAGIPYLAMEYVEGQTLDRYCAAIQPSLEQRLRIMIRMLDAIEFAHRRLIAHCDLKGSNVLVSTDGEPHLLDFGIAKLLNPAQLGSQGPVTLNFRPLTPEFASPEQLRGDPLSIATDLYSAGVLLYGLLTGEHPFEEAVMRPVDLLEAVCFQEPQPPSRRAASVKDPPVAARLLQGDLDAIVLQALRKDPEERYRSAREFADDLQHYLDGLPVTARRGSAWYRARKFMKRERGLTAAAALAFLAVVGGVAGTAWESYRAREARQRAEARFNDVRRLANTLLADFHEKVSKLPGATNAQKILVTQSLQYLDRLAGEHPSGGLALELAEGYIKMGNLQGSPYEANFGQSADALATLDKARSLAEQQAGSLPEDARAFSILTQAITTRADVLAGMGRMQEAVKEAREAAALSDRLVAAQPKSGEWAMLSTSCHELLGDKLGSLGTAIVFDRPGALKEYERALEMARQALLLDPSAPRPARAVAVLAMKVGDLIAESDPQAAVQRYRDAERLLRQLPQRVRDEMPNRRLGGSLARRLGETYTHMRQFDLAQQFLEQSVQTSDSILTIDPSNATAHWDAAVGVHALSELEESRSNPKEALRHAEQVVALLERMPSREASMTYETALAQTLVQVARLRLAAGHGPGSAETAARRGLAIARRVAGNAEASAQDLGRIAEMFLDAQPATLQDPRFALECARKAVQAGSASPDSPLVRLVSRAEKRTRGTN